ncbi:MAG: AI-2E family transporter [Desulfobacterales bacterium]|nr:MAG: AI-2E family transporter [Desulfobacterales bacterium]
MSDSSPHNIILWFFLALFFVSCFLLGWLLWPFLSVIVLAAVVTGIFNPIYRFLNRKFSSTLSSLLTCFIIFLVLFVPVSVFVGILANEAYDMYLRAKGALLSNPFKELIENSKIVDRINAVIANFGITITGDEVNKAIAELGRAVGLYLYEQARSMTANIFKFLIDFFFMLLIIFYLLIDSPRLVAFIVSLSPLPDNQDEKLIQKFKDMAGAILIGNGLGGLIQGTLGGAVFAICGFKSPFLWGVIMALLAFLPIVGIGAVFLPAAIYLFLQGRIGTGIFFVVFYVVLSGGIEYFFKPKVVGQRVQMHTLLVFLAIIGGLKLFGILGIIYGPLVVTAFLTLSDIYESSYQRIIEPLKRVK